MQNQFSRTRLLIGEEALKKLNGSKVAVFGIGGVGSYTVEALARAGIGHFVLIDDDKICITNINRQLVALLSTVGKYKVDIMSGRILDINRNAEIDVRKCFFSEENTGDFDFSSFDYIVDAIDTVSAKLVLIEQAKLYNVPIISCMGAGNKLDPTAFEVTDIYKTSVCPLAKVMRSELRKRNITSLKVVYSKEIPVAPQEDEEISCKNHCVCPDSTMRKCTARRQIPGSMSFVPSVAGLIIAGEVVKDLIK